MLRHLDETEYRYSIDTLERYMHRCFDRFDLAIELAGMPENERADADAKWAETWWNAAQHYAYMIHPHLVTMNRSQLN